MPPSPITLSSPLGDDLRFHAMTHRAGLSELGQTDLQLLSARPDLPPEALLGLPVSVALQLREGQRHVTGHVTRFGLAGRRGRHFLYKARLRPWLWLLTRTSDCRIFQDQSVPDIVKTVFQDHGVADFEFRLTRPYRTRTYCVQYRESDHDFVARLLQDEGIYWHFQHSAGKHKLVLVDDASSHEPAPGCEELPYIETADQGAGQPLPDTEYVTGWDFARALQPGRTVLTSYDFERPGVDLESQAMQARSHELADYECFDFQGDYTQADDGRGLADTWIEALQTRHERLKARSNAHGLAPGGLFGLQRHPRADQNARYLCVSATIQAGGDGAEAGVAAIPAGRQFRPPRRAAKPFVRGPQTAEVVGPAGQEIHTDKYGRVKLQFHWDRYGRRDEHSSCWVRVSSPWAGKNFGFVQIPRIGQEVVVDFLEGDPDQPLVTGRVYNAEQMPPWELPANATQSGVLTRSSQGGAYNHANALRFEDKKGEEQLWIHAEKNQDIEVENDETHWVGRDRTKTVDHDENVTVHNNRTERVDKFETISIGEDRKEHVEGHEVVTIDKTKTQTVKMAYLQNVLLAKMTNVGLAYSINVGAGMFRVITGMSTENVLLGAKSTTVAEDFTIKTGPGYRVTAEKEIKLVVGKSSLTMNSDGLITLSGADINILGTGQIVMEAKGDVIIKGKNVKNNT